MTKLIALITDFGLQDIYVGVIKGVIASINSHIPILDITHHIPPQDLISASFCLKSAYPYFPSETIYLAVVDPGVGSTRKAIALRAEHETYFIGPDNGLFTGILDLIPILEARELTNRVYWRSPEPSLTFHGRDIFASVAAHLASGVPFETLGEKIPLPSLVRLPLAPYQLTADGVVGVIQYIDYFGNLITNIPASLVSNKSWSVSLFNTTIAQSSTYSEQPQGELLALISSNGWVEIAINGGSAAQKLQLNLGDSIYVKFKD
ncbi:S-adenosyl-l-methionine hydroxide adenosyltransferase family protein [Gloeocapsa sp. PCC 73106]|uniref:SAM hydrolase/SAM-dependent halogenase family protein n=1 Tax=Gloeocapsa sp. PCC 73106 TaxID=102232 RepID=UPI0002AC9B8B|nr:SAM-dependent chlorinase/fluorinase [Gloeocapsa sp. PCC 73106]ELR99960.1 hypothetical protein GLO73106DRAFT_00038130 [Gloeocapsa sp. PCC 73106]